MATKDARGTKRTCQSDECGERFYDLNRDPITCPICGTVYEIAHAPQGAPVEEKKEEEKKPAKPAAPVDGDTPEDQIEDEADELADIETDDSIDDDDTFLEEEEQDTGDVSTIIKPARDNANDS